MAGSNRILGNILDEGRKFVYFAEKCVHEAASENSGFSKSIEYVNAITYNINQLSDIAKKKESQVYLS